MNNLILNESAYKIQMAEGEQESPMVACPRCGHVQERKPRTVCVSCKRFIAGTKARQDWVPKPKKALYPDLQQYLTPEGEEEPEKEVKFVKARRSFSALQFMRNVALVLIIGAAFYFGTAAALKASMGDVAYKHMTNQMQVSLAKVLKPKPAAPPAPVKKVASSHRRG